MTKEFKKNYIQIADLYLAYRKSKAEAFFNNMHPNALAFTEYESNLDKNLKKLLIKLNSSKPNWQNESDFIGGYLYIPKSLDTSHWEKPDEEIHYRAIDPISDWKLNYKSNVQNNIKANYRLIISPTVDYQIVSALWILKVGHEYDVCLDKNVSFGNRLRRKRPYWQLSKWLPQLNGDFNPECSGLFAPYFSGYKEWRDKGLASMKKSLKEGVSIDAITMDVGSFYHKVSPHFMLRKSFLKLLRINFSKDDLKFTKLLLESFDTWYFETPDYNDRREGALPVGLSASKVISNVLLYQFDKEMLKSLKPIYYGRYVDDIFLVIKSVSKMPTGKKIIKKISDKVNCLSFDNNILSIKFPYAKDSEIIFTKDKQKIFSLSSEHGLDFIDQISDQIRKQSSEYRLLPEVPLSGVEMASKALLATPSASLNADALRKADSVSVKRLGFSLLLRDIEHYSRDLMPDVWSKVRNEFYGLVHRHLLTPQGIFEFVNYYPRIFGLMISCGDFKDAKKLISGVFNGFCLLEETTRDNQNKRIDCQSYFVKLLVQAGIQASTAKGFESWTELGRLFRYLFKFDDRYLIPSRSTSLEKLSNRILLADWGSRSYKDYWYYSQEKDYKDSSIPKRKSIHRVLRIGAARKFQEKANLKRAYWKALAFPTRPLTIQEIILIAPSVLEDRKLLKSAILGLRGAGVPHKKHSFGLEDNLISIPLYERQEKVNIALTSLETLDSQWEGAAEGMPDRSLVRYMKIMKLVNSILQENMKINYLVFPELSIPRRWAIGMAQKLAKNGVSLISGLEYYAEHGSSTVVRNDCLVSLTTNWPGYNSSIIHIQPKLEPSHNEKKELLKKGKSQYVPKGNEKRLPIYNHSDYYFGILICSDLTNLTNRVSYQGKIDSLFVLEWNPDINTFNFLVESTSHDLHTFVIQVNNRAYGDSRIRAPFKETYRRDSVQIKGGISDFYVIGEIDFIKLRRFQNGNKSLKKLFKPVPIGFKVSENRKN